MRRGRWRRSFVKLVVALMSIAVAVVFLFPVAWMVTTSLKSTPEIFSIPPTWSFTPTLEHYRLYFGQAQILQRYLNTFIIALGASALSVFAGAMAGYAMARLPIRGTQLMSTLILASRAIPPIALVVPMFLMFRQFGMLDRHGTLILTYSTFMIPYVIWLMRGFFMALPAALEEAAQIDGCSRFGAFFRVILPNVLPGLSASFIFCVILGWNELLFALILSRRNAVTIPVSLAGMAADTEQGALWGPMMAVGTMAVIPVVIFALFVQRYLVTGLAAGATK
jgi:multiple sugar transport system permease protein